MNDAEHYKKPEHGCRQGASFKPFPNRGYTCIEVLPFLKGKPWNDVALGFVHALRPTHIRVTDGREQCDAQTWRATVTMNKDGKTISCIRQEVEVGLPDGVAHGAALHCALETGVESEQTKWHAIDGTVFYNGITGEVSIIDEKGKVHPYPTKKKRK